MPCDVNTSAPVLKLLTLAWKLAGNGLKPLTGEAADTALTFLNDTLSKLGAKPEGITFLTEIEFDGTGVPEYQVGLTTNVGPNIINTEPITYIATAHASLGQVTRPLDIVSQGSYNRIPFKYSGAWPQFITYFLGKDYTTVRIFPWPVQSYRIYIQCLQRLNLQSYFTSINQVPQQNWTFLEYEVARLLISHNYGMPAANFYQDYDKYEQEFHDANQQDFEMKNGTPSPMLKSLAGGNVGIGSAVIGTVGY